MSFIRKKENFTCDNCGATIAGDGYTNHCPACLYSKHVDVSPGDRMNLCKGLMVPLSVEQKNGAYVIFHRCSKCGVIKKNRAAKDDSTEALLSVAECYAKTAGGAKP